MNQKPSILLFGGRSDERLVSVASAQNISSRYPFNELWFLNVAGEVFRVSQAELAAHARPFETLFEPSARAFAATIGDALGSLGDRSVFIALHGTEGEDGTLQALFESRHVAFTGSGARPSQVCFDKAATKARVAEAGISVAPQAILARGSADVILRELEQFFLTHGALVAKPNASGSSFGLQMVLEAASIQPAAEAMAKLPYGTFLIERFITGRELTIGVLTHGGQTRVLPPSEVVLAAGRSFDYQGKYLGKGTREITPADLNARERDLAQEVALKAHQALGCYGYSRTDLILGPSGPVFIETNTLPGLSKASFIPQQLAAEGIAVDEFVAEQLKLAERRYPN